MLTLHAIYSQRQFEMGENVDDLPPGINGVVQFRVVSFVTPGKFVESGKQPLFHSFTDKNISFAVANEIYAAMLFFFCRFGAVGDIFDIRAVF